MNHFIRFGIMAVFLGLSFSCTTSLGALKVCNYYIFGNEIPSGESWTLYIDNKEKGVLPSSRNADRSCWNTHSQNSIPAEYNFKRHGFAVIRDGGDTISAGTFDIDRESMDVQMTHGSAVFNGVCDCMVVGLDGL